MMQIGDLVIVSPDWIQTGQERVGLIESRAEYKNCFVVRFFDGKSPSKNACHRDRLRKVTRSNQWQVKQESGLSLDGTS